MNNDNATGPDEQGPGYLDIEPMHTMRIRVTFEQLQQLQAAQLYYWRLRPNEQAPSYQDVLLLLLDTFSHVQQQLEEDDGTTP